MKFLTSLSGCSSVPFSARHVLLAERAVPSRAHWHAVVHCIGACLVVVVSMPALRAQSNSPLNRSPQPPVGAPQPVAGLGIMAGSVSHDSALVQVRLSESEELTEGDLPGAWGVVEFSLSSGASEHVLMAHSFPQRDFIARVKFDAVSYTHLTLPTTPYV